MKRITIKAFVLIMITVLLLASCTPAAPEIVEVIKEVEKEVEKVVEKIVEVEVETGPVTNVWGKPMPIDAAPPEEQVLTLPCQEGKHMDVSAQFYDSGKSCGAVLLWERVVMLNKEHKPVPGVATDWNLADDGVTWTFNLRKDAKWSDGTPLTAGDFEFSLKRQVDPATGSTWSWFYNNILNAPAIRAGNMDPDELGVTAIDDHTLQVVTGAKIFFLPEILAFPSSAPVPRHVYEEVGDLWTMKPETALSNGPWKMTEYTPGRQIVLEPNEYYVGDNLPYIQKFTFLLGDGVSDFPKYQADEVDALYADQDVTVVQPTTYRLAVNDPILRHELYAYPYWYSRYLFVNPNAEPWDDINFRRAVAHAIDRETMINVIFWGLGDPSYGLLPIGFPAYVEGALNQYQEYDLEKAQEFLAEAGYPGGAGVPEIELSYRSDGGEDLIRTAEMVQAMMKENLGIDIKMRPLESSIFRNELAESKISFGIHNWGFDFVDPSNFLNIFHPDYGRHKDWNNPEYNELVAKAMTWDIQEERIKMYEEANELLSKDVGMIGLYHSGRAQMWKPHVRGFTVTELGYKRVPYYHLGMHSVYVTPR